MSAIVKSDRDADWFTNSRAWAIILERATHEVEPARRDEFGSVADTIGVDFTLMDESLRPDVARWLRRAVEALSGPEAAEQGWDTELNRSHLGVLAAMLRPIAGE